MLSLFQGWASMHAGWVSAIGLVALGVYDISIQNYQGAGKAFLAALAAFGLHSVTRVDNAADPFEAPPGQNP